MYERQRPAGLEDPRGRQHFGCSGRLGLFEACESRRLENVALLEDRQRPREPVRMLGQPTEPEANRATDRSCPNPLDVTRGLCGRSDTSFAQRIHKHADQEGRPAACAQTGVDEDRIRNPSEPRLDKPGDGCAGQRRKTDHIGGWIACHRRKQLGIGAHLPRVGRHDERRVQLIEAREQEGQVTQGRGVCPVRVVDDHAKRTHSGQVRAQPVETVEDRERGIDARRGRDTRRRCPWQPKESRGHAGSGLQQVGALELRRFGQRRLEQLAYHSEGEIALQLGPPCPQHAHSAVCRSGPRRRKQRRLANASRPFDHHERAPSRASLGQRRLDARQLLAPFEELLGGCAIFHISRAYAHMRSRQPHGELVIPRWSLMKSTQNPHGRRCGHEALRGPCAPAREGGAEYPTIRRTVSCALSDDVPRWPACRREGTRKDRGDEPPRFRHIVGQLVRDGAPGPRSPGHRRGSSGRRPVWRRRRPRTAMAATPCIDSCNVRPRLRALRETSASARVIASRMVHCSVYN